MSDAERERLVAAIDGLGLLAAEDGPPLRETVARLLSAADRLEALAERLGERENAACEECTSLMVAEVEDENQAALAGESAALERVAELQSATYCAYCGQKFRLDDAAATLVTEHIHTCPKHPMRAVEAERDRALRILARVEAALKHWPPPTRAQLADAVADALDSEPEEPSRD